MSALDFEISQRPEFAIVSIQLQSGQKVYSEPAAMASMTPSLTMKAGFKGGLKKALGRVFAGESMIVNTFTAETEPGEVVFAPGTPGDLMHYKLDNNSIYLQRGAFLAHSEGVEISAKWGGAKGFFSGTGLVLLKAQGTGDLFFNSFGAILEIDVADEYVVDTGYVVAFEDTLEHKVVALKGSRPAKTIKNFLFGGEGLVCRFSGQGRVWIQTRYVYPLLSWVYPFRPVQSKN
jgi:uncharacterized protein (TIGR00266 family)